MMKTQKRDLLAGMFLLCAATGELIARDNLSGHQDERNGAAGTAAFNPDDPSLIEIMIQDGEGVTVPTPVNGGYLTGVVTRQLVRANWLQSEIGVQLIQDGERLDPRRYQVEWTILGHPGSAVKARLVEAPDADYGLKIQVESPLTTHHTRVLGTLEVEAKIFDREQPDEAPVVVVQSLRELLENGRNGL